MQQQTSALAPTLRSRVMHGVQTIARVFQRWRKRMWYRVCACIPGTRPFKRARCKRVARQAMERWRQYRRLSGIDTSTKHRTWHRIRVMRNQLLIMERRVNALHWIISIIIVTALLGVVVGGPLVLSGGNAGNFVIILLGGGFLVSIPIWLAVVRDWILPPPYPRGAVMIIVVMVIGYGLLWWLASAQSPNLSVVERVLLIPIVFYSSFLVLISVVSVAQQYVRFYRRNTYPDSIIVDRLLHILLLLDHQPTRWTDLAFRRKLMDLLEEVAITMEYHYPRVFASGDVITTVTVQDTARQMALPIRQLKLWLSTPKADTMPQFTAVIRAYFVQAVEQQWDAWPRETPPHQTPAVRRRVWMTWVQHTVRLILTALVPLGLFYLVQVLQQPFTETQWTWITIGGVLWICITIVAAVDSRFDQKLASLKDVWNWLRSTS